MKPQVDFFIPSYENEDEGMVLHFTSVDEIDSVIESLNEARAELEHQIEMKRIKNREKRKRRKERIDLDKLNLKGEFKADNLNEHGEEEDESKMYERLKKDFNEIYNLYNNLPECKFKSDLKPYIELTKALFKAINNQND